MKLSVIIPTYYRNDLLAKCLGELAPVVQVLSIEQYEVIVSDDGMKHTAERMVKEKYTWAKWVAGPGRGPASNRNNGAKHAKGEWLVFLDDDCVPDRNILSAYLAAINSYPLANVFEGRISADRPKV